MTLFNVLVGKTYMAIKSNPVSLFFHFVVLFIGSQARHNLLFGYQKGELVQRPGDNYVCIFHFCLGYMILSFPHTCLLSC